MANSTNTQNLDLNANQWQGLLRLQNKIKGFTPSRVVISKAPGKRIYTVQFTGPRSMPRQKTYLLYPNGDTKVRDDV